MQMFSTSGVSGVSELTGSEVVQQEFYDQFNQLQVNLNQQNQSDSLKGSSTQYNHYDNLNGISDLSGDILLDSDQAEHMIVQ